MDIEKLDYVSFISRLNETNRPPGGKHTVRFWIQHAFLGPASTVLEIGSNTGFTSLELARSCKCMVTGIDVSPTAVAVSNDTLAKDVPSIQKLVRFEVGDARALDFAGESFDAIVCGGALSFIVARAKALEEMQRVLRPWGFLCVAPLCYRETPPESLLDDLAEVLGFRVPVLSSDDWMSTLCASGWEHYSSQLIQMKSPDDSTLVKWVEALVQDSSSSFSVDVLPAVRQRALRTWRTFSRNQVFLEALVGVFRKRVLLEQPELFPQQAVIRH